MTNRHKASLWIGTEKEQGSNEEETTKLFVDGASYGEIQSALESHPDVEEVYFAHGFEYQTVRKLENKVKVTIEVTEVGLVPEKLKGRVNVILRAPTWVTGFKMVERGQVLYSEKFDEVTEWDGRKVHEDDTVLIK